MSALMLKAHLEQLMQRHDCQMPTLLELPMVDPGDDPLIFEGLASTGDRDAEFCVFAPYAFGFDFHALPPLLLEHDPAKIAGHVESLAYDGKGQLKVSAYVSDREARRRSAFSIGCKVRQFEIRDVDSPSRFHAHIKQATLTDIAIVSHPVNSRARVLRREPPSPLSRYAASQRAHCDLAIRGVQIIRKQIELLSEAK